MFNDTPQPRRLSEVSIQSTVSGLIDNIPLQAVSACKYFQNKIMCSKSVFYMSVKTCFWGSQISKKKK